MKLGPNASGLANPAPSEAAPFALVRFGGGVAPLYYTAIYGAMLAQNGIDPLPTAPWTHPDEGEVRKARFAPEPRAAKWKALLREWSANVPGELHLFGNEPPPEHWDLYRERLRFASGVLRGDGHQVGLAPAITRRTGEFLRSFDRAAKWNLVDAVDVHPYGHTPADVRANVRAARKLVPSHLPMLASEFGWGVKAPDSPPGHPFVVASEREQADNITETVKLLRKDGILEAACVFTWATAPADQADTEHYGKWWRTAGVHREDGSERPAAAAMRELAGARS